jgi:hypothetical protein
MTKHPIKSRRKCYREEHLHWRHKVKMTRRLGIKEEDYPNDKNRLKSHICIFYRKGKWRKRALKKQQYCVDLFKLACEIKVQEYPKLNIPWQGTLLPIS